MTIGFSDGSTAEDWPSFYAKGSLKTDPKPEEGTTPSLESPMIIKQEDIPPEGMTIQDPNIRQHDPNDLKHLNERKTPLEEEQEIQDYEDDMTK